MASSPQRGEGTLQEQLDWYKVQYAQLETDLADFQASSKELEEQLEKDVETAEKNERKWKAQVEKLNFEVEEWKTKHKQAKAEANTAQNTLQREITTLRDVQRSLQLKLRDTEVMNDDYERQARNTESSLEDMESKCNVAIERGVMLETEVKQGEQEREALRIETQRLRDELGDLKIENEITLEKLRLSEVTVDGMRTAKPSPLAVESLRARSPGSEASGMTPLSPTASTPPPRSDTASEAATPPSPPLSDAPSNLKAEQRTPVPAHGRRAMASESAATPKPPTYGASRTSRHARGPSTSSTGVDGKTMKPPSTRTARAPSSRNSHLSSDHYQSSLPRSDSLYQIRGLIGRMQKIEERVHSARSKLPGPSGLTPRGSPRSASKSLVTEIPASVTMRRHSKRPSGSFASSSVLSGEDEASNGKPETTRIKRLSFGIPRPPSAAAGRSDLFLDRPPSSAAMDRPPSAMSRPSSRASLGSASHSYNQHPHRPASRAGARTADSNAYHSTYISGSNASGSTQGYSNRPRSSIGGDYTSSFAGSHHSSHPHPPVTPRSHRSSASISELRKRAAQQDDAPGSDSSHSGIPIFTTTPSANRRTTLEKASAIPTPARRQSGGGPNTTATTTTSKTLKRTSSGFHHAHSLGPRDGGGEMRPPALTRKRTSGDLGETY
ncbi:hypothetical protein MRB53_040491 [Persea americana]|nr:hypothetical protein MRB53_040491 [Persea americana]